LSFRVSGSIIRLVAQLPGVAGHPAPCGRITARMDPSRKRAIRLTVALTAALLLASALVFVSFSAGHEEVTAAQLLARAKPGSSYILAGTVLDGSVRRAGDALLFSVRDPKLKLS